MARQDTPKHLWVVRAGNDNQLAQIVERKKAIAIGWTEMGDISQLKSREELRERYTKVYSDHSPARVNVGAGQVYRFARKFMIGDYVLTYDKSVRELIVGIVRGDMEYKPDLFGKDYPNIRRVEWLKRISRDQFSAGARNSLGSALTVFRIDEHLAEVQRLVSGEKPTSVETESEEIPFHEEMKSKADELIADLITKLDPYDFQELVAGVLRAMGFRAQSSAPGRDKGVDVIAYPDALGFGKPRIKVQVKHRSSSAGGPDLRNFLATLDNDENGLFISTGGFGGDAFAERDRARATITLLDRDGFIELLLEHYEKLQPEFQAKIPLKKVWVPA